MKNISFVTLLLSILPFAIFAQNYADDFNSNSQSGGTNPDGAAWTPSWVIGGTADSEIDFSSGVLTMFDDGSWAQRGADLDCSVPGNITFDYSTIGAFSGNCTTNQLDPNTSADRMEIHISNDGGSSWTWLSSIVGAVGTQTGYSFPIPDGYNVAGFALRLIPANCGGFNEASIVDNLVIETVVPTSTDIAVTKTVDKASADPGEQVVYTLTATNNTCIDANMVVIADTLPSCVTLESSTGTGVYDGSTWTIPAVPMQSSVSIDITAEVVGMEGTSCMNTAALTSIDGVMGDADSNNDMDDATFDINVLPFMCPPGSQETTMEYPTVNGPGSYTSTVGGTDCSAPFDVDFEITYDGCQPGGLDIINTTDSDLPGRDLLQLWMDEEPCGDPIGNGITVVYTFPEPGIGLTGWPIYDIDSEDGGYQDHVVLTASNSFGDVPLTLEYGIDLDPAEALADYGVNFAECPGSNCTESYYIITDQTASGIIDGRNLRVDDNDPRAFLLVNSSDRITSLTVSYEAGPNLPNVTSAQQKVHLGTFHMCCLEPPAAISGVVYSDDNGDGMGDTGLPGVMIEVSDGTNTYTVTTANGTSDDLDDDGNIDPVGFYYVGDLPPGTYTVTEIDPDGYSSVSDTDSNIDGGDDTDPADGVNDNSITVELIAGEEDTGNDFVDELAGTISGTVWQDNVDNGSLDKSVGVPDVVVNLLFDNGSPVQDLMGNNITATTDADGNYSFSNVPPGDYQVEIVETGLPPIVYENDDVNDGADDGEVNDGTTINNKIPVSIGQGTQESDSGNDFVVADFPLPVEFISFSGIEKNKTIILSWKVGLELNNDRFIIERKGINTSIYNEVGSLEGRGSAVENHSYTFTDFNPLNGINYYRLKQIDADGKYAYSNTISLTIKGEDINIYPNPVREKLFIPDLGVNEVITIHNVNGEQVRVNKDLNVLDVSNLLPGVYFVYIESKGIRKRFIKL